MAKKDEKMTNRESPQRGGKSPKDTGSDKAEIKDIHGQEGVERDEEMRKRFEEGQDKELSKHTKEINPNRNTDKPDIDKPAYD